MTGTLFVVATPLGNLEDISPRALDVLRQASCVACEDTRRTAKLLARYGIEVPLVSYHRFNERGRVAPLLARLRRGESIALVTDGGTPGISDPGRVVVEAALEEGLPVRTIPGPSAVTALLAASGLPADRFVFDGFLPARSGERRRRLRELSGETRTLVLFEVPHRISQTLADIEEVFGERVLVVGRELTKVHETILRGTAAGIAAALGAEPRGEIVLALAGAAPGAAATLPEVSGDRILACWRGALEQAAGDRRVALRNAARELGLDRSALYRALAERGERGE